MSDHKLRATPASFLLAGAALVHLRHAAKDGDADEGLFNAAANAVLSCEPEIKSHGMNFMDCAEGVLDIDEAKVAYMAGDHRRSWLLIMRGHSKLAAHLAKAGIAQPTDEQIMEVHKKQLTEARAAAGAGTATMSTLAAKVNSR